MTDDIAAYGLGALPDAPDERDYPLSALYASEGITASVVLPAGSSRGCCSGNRSRSRIAWIGRWPVGHSPGA